MSLRLESVSRITPCRLIMSVFVGLLMVVNQAVAGEFNEVLNIGSPAPSWKDLPGTDGKKHSLSDYSGKDVLVVIFTCASCPTAVDYEGRIEALTKKFGGPNGKVAVVAVCSHILKVDKLDALTARAQEKKFTFDYLHDESQAIARSFGAIFTPEFYVFDKDRKLVYMGAMDDQTNEADVKVRYVEDAIQAALAGKLPTTRETIARGCRVRYVRERRGS